MPRKSDGAGWEILLALGLEGRRAELPVVFILNTVEHKIRHTMKQPAASPSPINGQRAGVRGQAVRLMSSLECR